jgi:hypothetical protein
MVGGIREQQLDSPAAQHVPRRRRDDGPLRNQQATDAIEFSFENRQGDQTINELQIICLGGEGWPPWGIHNGYGRDTGIRLQAAYHFSHNNFDL